MPGELLGRHLFSADDRARSDAGLLRLKSGPAYHLVPGIESYLLQELSQNELSRLTGIPQSTISAIEDDRVQLNVERAKVLAQALSCHPAVLVFPGWEVRQSSATCPRTFS